MHIEVTVDIDRPMQEVFAFTCVEHVANHPRWDPSVIKIEQESGAFGQGSRLAITRRTMGRVETRSFDVVQWEPPKRMVIETRSRGFSLRLVQDLQPVDGRTRLTLSGDAEIGGVRSLFVPLMKKRFQRDLLGNVARIKQMVEAEASTA